jgi:serine/threonine-protein kinase
MSDVSNNSADPLPATIGRYQITGSLGFGAMGAVYKAFDPLIRRSLAIKTVRLDIPRSSPQYRSFIDRFQHEAQISGTLSHPGIVTLFDLGEDNGQPFFAMEFVDGRTIAELLAEGTRFKPERVIGLVSQVAAALDYAHSRGVVHRDIKPANLILYEGDKVKITDFGIAKLADADITHAGALLGTPSYMSPEQAMGEKLDGRSDIFSLGVVAFEMLSGLQPFPGPNVTSILYKLVHVDPIEPSDLETNGLVPHKWREVFQKVLAKKPERRYQTASAFVQDLEYCLGSWFTGLGSVETVTLAGSGEVKTPELPRAAAAAPPARGGASPLVAHVEEVETLLIPRQPAPGTGQAGATTLVLDARTGELEEPSTPTLRAAAEVTAVEPAAEVASAAATPPIEASRTWPPDPTAPALPSPAEHPPVAAPPRPARRPGLPLPLLIGAGAAFVALVGLGAWALRPRGPVTLEPASGTAPVAPAPQEPLVPQPAAAPATSGTLRVTSEPEGARVLVDGRARGRSPLELGELGFGRYQVRVEQPGYEPEERRVELDAGAPAAELRLTLRRRAAARATPAGAADFVSTPAGAAVSVDGRPAGTTPLRGYRLQPGRRRVEIALEGHETWSSTLEVAAGETGRVDVRLRPRPAAPPTPVPVDVSRVYLNEPGQVDTLARQLSGRSPSYPSGRGVPRLRSGQRVSVLLRFVVTDTGDVTDVVVVESAGKLVDDAVVEAVRAWKYEPATVRGVRVKVQTSRRWTFLGA